MDLLAAALVGDEGDRLAVGRILDVAVAGRAVGELAEVAAFVGRGGEELAVHAEDDPLAVGGQVVVVDGRIIVAKFGQSLLGFGDDLERNGLDLAAGDVELPDAEVVLEDDRFAVAADCRGNERRRW